MEFLLGKSLSSKVLINKEVLGIVGVVLDEIEFRFDGCLVDFLLIFVLFDDMGGVKGFREGGIVILADFVVDLGFLMIKF